MEHYYFSLLPLALLIVVLAFWKLDKLVLLVVFLVPLSVPLSYFDKSMPFNMSLPSEPLLFGIMAVFFAKLLIEKKIDKRLINHPVSYAIYLNIFWIFLTTISSSMILVSFKFLLARLWFVVAFYFLATLIFKKYKNIKLYIWLFIISMLIVITYTVTRHIIKGFDDIQAAHFVMRPFFSDHTSYGAILAMIIPALIGLNFRANYPLNIKLLIFPLLVAFGVAIVFSYTRAAWVSLLGAFGVWIVFLLKIKFRTLLIVGSIVLFVVISNFTDMMLKMQKNQQDSSSNLSEHVESISNVASDASNLERLNRWQSAFRMFKERPVLGWGPGTYMFQYASFQLSKDKTVISTNAGDLGNAHSEYIGPLAEQGVLGMLTFLLILITTIYTATRVYYNTSGEVKMLCLISFLGLVTYYLHGLLNNYLDTDKASVLFWGYTAIIVAIDIYHSPKTSINN